MKTFSKKYFVYALAALSSCYVCADESISFTYDSFGHVLTENGPRTDVSDITTYTYDAAGNRITLTNALGQVTHYNSYDGAGHLLSVTDANNITTEFTYHDRGWLLSSTLKHPTDSTLDRKTNYGYDAVGNLTNMTLPNGYQLFYEYDDAHRLTAIKNSAGERIEYTLDVAGNRTKETIKNSAGVIKYSVNSAYDELSRVMAITGNNNQNTRQQYDANDNPTITIDGRNNQTQQNYDALNRVAKIIDPNLKETQFTYDSQHHIKSVIDARGNITTYNYDGLGNLISQISPDTGTTTFTYDAAGNRTKATDARNVVANYTYDALNRLKSVGYPAASSENVVYGYDDIASGVWGSNYGIGRLTSVTNTVAATTYKYNEAGFIKMKRASVNGIMFVTSYTYDAANNLASITYPSGRIVNYTRDSAGRVQAIKTKLNAIATEQNVVTNINYLPFGPASSYTFGNNLSHVANYDNDYRLTGITVGGILNRSYGYDPVDNITTINNLLTSTKNQTFAYDALNRLTTATGVYGNLGYSYDAVGNRLTETSATQAAPTTVTTNTYIYPATNNRLTSISKKIGATASGTRNFVYDNAGNRTQGTTEDNKLQDYTYNNANRLTTTKVTSALAGTYVYNALSQRVIKTIGSTTTKELYQYDEVGQLIAVTDAAGYVLREYIYNGNQLVSVVISTAPVIATTVSVTTDQATLQNAVLAKIFTGYSGTAGYIQFNGEGQASWPIVATVAANHTVAFSYSLASGSRAMDLYIDGVKKTQLTFTGTGSGSSWSSITATLSLTAGNHTLVLKTTGAGGPNLDRVRVTPLIAQPATNTTYYVHTDHQGTPQVVTAQNQSVAWMADYQPFGKLQSGQTNSIELYSRFPGQFLDTETGLYYNYFRDYDASIGRYIESDPIGLQGGVNTFAYVDGNPLMGIDPKGQSAVSLALLVGGTAWATYQGYEAGKQYSQDQCKTNHKFNDRVSDPDKYDPSQEVARRAEEFSNAMRTYGPIGLKLMVGVGLAGAGAGFSGAGLAFTGATIGFKYGEVNCTCQP